MSSKSWEVIKTCYCQHIDTKSGWKPSWSIRLNGCRTRRRAFLPIVARKAVSCNLDGRPSCVWAGTNPVFDPFIETF